MRTLAIAVVLAACGGKAQAPVPETGGAPGPSKETSATAGAPEPEAASGSIDPEALPPRHPPAPPLPDEAGTGKRPCPDGTTLVKTGRDRICQTADGTRRGPATTYRTFSGVSVRTDYDAVDGAVSGQVVEQITTDGETLVRVGEWSGPLRLGDQRTYEKGVLVGVSRFGPDGRPVAMITYYRDGRRMSKAEVRGEPGSSGELHGLFARWYDNGQRASEERYVADEPTGEARYFDRAGAAIDKTAFEPLWKAQSKRAEAGQK